MNKLQSRIILLLMCILSIGLIACSKDEGHQEGQNPTDEAKVYFVYTLDTSTGNLMTRATSTNEEVFNEFYAKIKTGELVAESYDLTLTEVTTGVKYTFKGKWNSHDLVTLSTGTYKVVGTSTAEGENIQEKCSFTFNEQVEISISSKVITLHANYDSALLIFKNSDIQSLQNFNGTELIPFFTFSTYKYAFVNGLLYQDSKKNEAYILGKYTDNAEFKIFTGNLNFEKGKYYVYNSVTNGFDIPPMEDGSNVQFVEVCGIKWAKGNLQYDAINGGDATFQNNWRLAPSQWHFFHYADGITTYNAKTTDKQVDLFTWGVCGNWIFLNDVSKYATAQNAEIKSKLFLDADCTTETTDFEDAKYGDIAYWATKGKYRLPSLEEINLLVNEASFHYGYYLTDNKVKIYGYLFTSPQSARITDNNERQIKDSDLESGLFLPMGGEGHSSQTTIECINSKVSYWSSTVKKYPQALHMNHVNGGPTLGSYSGYTGHWPSDFRMVRPVLVEK